MKILVDGCIFSEAAGSAAAHFWKKLLETAYSHPERGFAIYFLDRGGAPKFRNTRSWINLSAPKVEWRRASLEDRRLARLCSEIGSDIFVSTYHTSAGAQVRSLVLLAADSGSDKPGRTQSPRQREYNLATDTWAVSYRSQVAHTWLLQQFWAKLNATASRVLTPEEITRRDREEQDIIAEAEEQRTDLSACQIVPVPLTFRLKKGLSTPHRYAEFLSRTFRNLVGRIA